MLRDDYYRMEVDMFEEYSSLIYENASIRACFKEYRENAHTDSRYERNTYECDYNDWFRCVA